MPKRIEERKTFASQLQLKNIDHNLKIESKPYSQAFALKLNPICTEPDPWYSYHIHLKAFDLSDREIMMVKYLETFFSVAETLSYTKTAEHLNIAQSAVSRQIKLLEEELGLQLFIRTTQSVHLTEQGRNLLLKLKPLYSEIQSSIEEAQTNKSQLQGSIRIGSTVEAGKHILLPQLLQFQQKFPSIQFHLSLESSFQVQEKVRAGVLDFGLVSSSIEVPGVRSYTFLRDTPVLICAKKYSGRGLLHQDPIRVVFYRDQDEFANAFLKRNFDRKSQKSFQSFFAVNSHEAMVEILQNQESVAVIPKTSFEVLKKSHSLHLLKEGKDSYNLNLLTPDHPIHEKRKKELFDHLMAGGEV